MKITEKTFLQTYDESADSIYRYCYFRLFDHELARDLTQEAFLRSWQKISQGADIDNLRAFVYKVARNLMVDYLRKKKEIALEAMAVEPSVDFKAVEDDVDTTLLLQSLEKIQEPYREAVVMRYLDGLTPKQIAEILQESPNVVSIRITRGVKQLKELLDANTHGQNN